MNARLLIVEDHLLFAEVLADLLRAEGVEVVGIATNGPDALSAARRERPDIVVVDLGLGDVDGFTVGRAILADQPSAIVVALTARRDPRALAEATASGFHSYMTKDIPLPRFVALLRGVLAGRSTAPTVLRRPAHVAGDARFALRQLSSRERDVLELLREGLGTDAVAERLGVSRNTIRSHIQRILTKLQVHSRLEAVALTDRGRARTVRTSPASSSEALRHA